MIKAKYSASITDMRNEWWNLAPNCVAAYQPKGANNYDASKINLANPGVNNAENGAAYPTWDAEFGWKFTRASSQYLTCGIVPTSTYSMVIRFSNVSAAGAEYHMLAGVRNVSANNNRFALLPYHAANQVGYYHGQASVCEPGLIRGVLALTPGKGYRNGVFEKLINGWGTASGQAMVIGAANWDLSIQHFLNGYIQAVWVGTAELTPGQVLDITNAMNAL